jgi:predicted nucleotide-binding protein
LFIFKSNFLLEVQIWNYYRVRSTGRNNSASYCFPNVNLDELKHTLNTAGYAIKKEQRLPNDTGFQIRLTNGAIVNCFDNGTVSVQGKNRDVVEKAVGAADILPNRGVAPSSKVFVVYGHDQSARDQLEAMLRRWGLDPIIFDQMPSEGATLIEKLENYVGNVGFGVVLATPDDVGYPRSKEDQKAFRARQNVVLELGMLLAHLGRKKVAILLEKGFRRLHLARSPSSHFSLAQDRFLPGL